MRSMCARKSDRSRVGPASLTSTRGGASAEVSGSWPSDGLARSKLTNSDHAELEMWSLAANDCSRR